MIDWFLIEELLYDEYLFGFIFLRNIFRFIFIIVCFLKELYENLFFWLFFYDYKLNFIVFFLSFYICKEENIDKVKFCFVRKIFKMFVCDFFVCG